MTLIATNDDMMPVQASSLGTGLLWGGLVFVATANLLHEGLSVAVPGLSDLVLCMVLATFAAVISAVSAATRQWEAAAAASLLMALSML